MELIKIALSALQSKPLNVTVWKIFSKILRRKIPSVEKWKELVFDKVGIEIGGPSSIFAANNFLPIYPYVKSLDGVNFSSQTVWEGQIEQGATYKYEGRIGNQFIAEGADLHKIKSNSYDFLLSCNNLEHIANPLKALKEWQRVIKGGGTLILILPRKESNFDHRRAITSLEHIIKDYENNVDESDTTVINEVLQLHDLKRDPRAGSFENFEKRCADNLNNRCLHHHVFDTDLLKQLMEYIGLKTVITYSSPTDHFIAAVK